MQLVATNVSVQCVNVASAQSVILRSIEKEVMQKGGDVSSPLP